MEEAMSELTPLSDEDLDVVVRVAAEVSGAGVVLLKTWVAAMAAELRARRAADLSEAEREGLRQARRVVFHGRGCVDAHQEALAITVLDRLLGGRP
jgi:electron transfer flavoprotein alpha subunit